MRMLDAKILAPFLPTVIDGYAGIVFTSVIQLGGPLDKREANTILSSPRSW